MSKKIKIVLYYIFMFFAMCTLIYLIELKSSKDIEKSYESANYAGYEKYVSVPKNLEVLGRGEQTTYIETIVSTLQDELLMFLFLIISTIPLAIFYSAKYIEKLDEETNALISITNNEYLQDKEEATESINANHRGLFTEGYLNYKKGIFCGMLSDHLKMKDIYVSINDEVHSALIFENDNSNLRFISKILKGISYDGEGILVIDLNNKIYDSTKDIMLDFGYDVRRIDLSKEDNSNVSNLNSLNKINEKLLKKNKKYKSQNKLDLLKYFDSKNDIMNLSSIITKGNSYATKMLASLIYVVLNENKNEKHSLLDVYELAKQGINKVATKTGSIKEAYNTFNELILLDNNAKKMILDEVVQDLENFNDTTYDLKDEKDDSENIIRLEDIKNKPIIYYINFNDLSIANASGNLIIESIYNICKNEYLKDNTSQSKKVYVLNTFVTSMPKQSYLYDRLKDSYRYGLCYILGIENTKHFKDKYDYDFERIIENSNIKIFYAVRQYETTETLKEVLNNKSLDEIANIINSLDTNKCILNSKYLDHLVLNIDEPSGEKYEKYTYGSATNEKEINKIKNKDVKLKVNYLDEFKDRIEEKLKKEKIDKEQEKEQEQNKNKKDDSQNVKPELTSEEKEYIANLLKEKNENAERKNKVKNISHSSNEFDFDDIKKDVDNVYGDKKDLIVSSLNNLYDKYDTDKIQIDEEDNKEDNDNYDDEILSKGYTSDDKLEKLEKESRNELNKAKKLKTEEDINESLDKLSKLQDQFEELIKEEKKKTTHALYEQIKNLK